MIIVNRHSPFVMIPWDDFEKILKAVPRERLLSLFRWDFGQDALTSKNKKQIIDLIYQENEGDIV